MNMRELLVLWLLGGWGALKAQDARKMVEQAVNVELAARLGGPLVLDIS
jgi:hypothetical protein